MLINVFIFKTSSEDGEMRLTFFLLLYMILLIESELESEARLAAVRTENESKSLREARLAADVERVIVSRDNESESLRDARLAADVERVIVARENESES